MCGYLEESIPGRENSKYRGLRQGQFGHIQTAAKGHQVAEAVTAKKKVRGEEGRGAGEGGVHAASTEIREKLL